MHRRITHFRQSLCFLCSVSGHASPLPCNLSPRRLVHPTTGTFTLNGQRVARSMKGQLIGVTVASTGDRCIIDTIFQVVSESTSRPLGAIAIELPSIRGTGQASSNPQVGGTFFPAKGNLMRVTFVRPQMHSLIHRLLPKQWQLTMRGHLGGYSLRFSPSKEFSSSLHHFLAFFGLFGNLIASLFNCLIVHQN